MAFFDQAVRAGRLKPGPKLPKVEPSIKPNPQALNVDVTVEIKDVDLEEK